MELRSLSKKIDVGEELMNPSCQFDDTAALDSAKPFFASPRIASKSRALPYGRAAERTRGATQ
jgi:hypothetical protein